MWDSPAALNRISALVLVLTLLFAVVTVARGAFEVWLPIRTVEVRGAGQADTRAALRPALSQVSGSLFSADLAAVRQAVETLPWVRSATVRRQWPGTLAIELNEHVPIAAWNDLAVLDVHGEVFPIRPWAGLPRIFGPDGMEGKTALRYGEFARELSGHGWRIASLRVDAREAWQLVLADGVEVNLGRERMVERLRRFVMFYPLAQARVAGIRRVDLRYPNGFAVLGSPAESSPGGAKT